MYKGIGTMRNTATYRQEQNTNDNDGYYYSLKTGNIFTDDTTFSLKKACEWVRNGGTVWKVNNRTGQVIEKYYI